MVKKKIPTTSGLSCKNVLPDVTIGQDVFTVFSAPRRVEAWSRPFPVGCEKTLGDSSPLSAPENDSIFHIFLLQLFLKYAKLN